MHTGEIIQIGELVVVGKGEIGIALKNRPCKIVVRFIHELNCIPCNPHHKDLLEYELIRTHKHNYHCNRYTLIIKWRVASIREIEWKVFY